MKVDKLKPVINPDRCSGCAACAIICPKRCICLQEDENGFDKAYIAEEVCIHCGKCLQVCPLSEAYKVRPLDVSDSFTVSSRIIENSIKSSSSGIANLLASEAISRGYIVIGADWDLSNGGAKHIIVRDKNDLDKLRKSKYVFSSSVEAFGEVDKEDKVMVFGTPCQIAGLRNAYPNKKEMVLVDFDCMGPAGRNLLRKYIAWHMRKNTSGIKRIEMRDKSKDWINYGIRVKYWDGTEYFADKYHDPFCQLFNFAHTLQKACTNYCPFKQSSEADIRIGDAWDYIDQYAYKEAKNGLSLVSLQSTIGSKWFSDIEEHLNIQKADRRICSDIKIITDEKLMEMLRDKNSIIEDIVQVYKTIPVTKRVTNYIVNILSKNYKINQIYKIVKRKRKE